MKNVALVLAGCGAKDGAEITESVSLMIALSQAGLNVKIFAPDRDCFHVVNHLNNEVMQSSQRNALVEAARIARGQISSLAELRAQEFDALCFAGGFGVAKNLCDFAFSGKDAVLNDDVKAVLFDFIRNKKAVAALCIAPILLALAAKELNLSNVQLTVGESSSDAAKIISSWGIHHLEKKVFEACIDKNNKFVTSPAYMDDNATPADIFASASALVDGLNSMA